VCTLNFPRSNRQVLAYRALVVQLVLPVAEVAVAAPYGGQIIWRAHCLQIGLQFVQ